MPLPTPHEDESKDKFMSRCMGDSEAKKTFPDDKQRLAVCFRQFGEKKEEKASHPEMQIQATVTFDLEGEQP